MSPPVASPPGPPRQPYGPTFVAQTTPAPTRSSGSTGSHSVSSGLLQNTSQTEPGDPNLSMLPLGQEKIERLLKGVERSYGFLMDAVDDRPTLPADFDVVKDRGTPAFNALMKYEGGVNNASIALVESRIELRRAINDALPANPVQANDILNSLLTKNPDNFFLRDAAFSVQEWRRGEYDSLNYLRYTNFVYQPPEHR
jgi:hypothetical protein